MAFLTARLPRLVLVAGFLLAARADGSEKRLDEYDVKAAFLLNFTKFVEWPEEATGRPLVICIVGDDPFGATIDGLLEQTASTAGAVTVSRLGDPSSASLCHIAFVRSAERDKSVNLLRNARGVPVLTVGESPDFAERGGVVSLPVEEGRVRVVINTAAAERANLRISAKLLSLARRVTPE